MEDKRAHERIEGLEKRMLSLETSMAENTALTKQTAASTSEVAASTKELVTLVKGAKGLRTFISWFTPIAATTAWAASYLKDHLK